MDAEPGELGAPRVHVLRERERLHVELEAHVELVDVRRDLGRDVLLPRRGRVVDDDQVLRFVGAEDQLLPASSRSFFACSRLNAYPAFTLGSYPNCAGVRPQVVASANPLKTLRRMSAVSMDDAKARRTRASWNGWNGAGLPVRVLHLHVHLREIDRQPRIRPGHADPVDSILPSSSHFFLSITSKIAAVAMSAMSTVPDLRLSSRVA